MYNKSLWTWKGRLTNNNVNTLVEFPHVLADWGTTNASVALGSHVVAQSHDHLLDLLGQLTGWGKDQGLAVPQLRVDLRK